MQLGGFDTHDTQAKRHSTLLSQLGAAFEYFDQLMVTAGLSSQVTLFTASDFGRTLTANSDGTDHGWAATTLSPGEASPARISTVNTRSWAPTRPTTRVRAG